MQPVEKSIDVCSNIISKAQMLKEFSLHPLWWFKGEFSVFLWVVGGKGHGHVLENDLDSRIASPVSFIFPLIITRMAFTYRFLFTWRSQNTSQILSHFYSSTIRYKEPGRVPSVFVFMREVTWGYNTIVQILTGIVPFHHY